MPFQSILELDFFKDLEQLCREVWDEVYLWPMFAQKTVGSQLVRALDSVDANLAESEGRWHAKAAERGLFRKSDGTEFVRMAESIHKRFNRLLSYRRSVLST